MTTSSVRVAYKGYFTRLFSEKHQIHRHPRANGYATKCGIVLEEILRRYQEVAADADRLVERLRVSKVGEML